MKTTINIDIAPNEWLLANHRVHYQAASKKRGLVSGKVKTYARTWNLPRFEQPVTILGRAFCQKGTLPDCDGIAPMMKAAIDGLVYAHILPDDNPQWVRMVCYARPQHDRSMREKWHRLELIITDEKTPTLTEW